MNANASPQGAKKKSVAANKKSVAVSAASKKASPSSKSASTKSASTKSASTKSASTKSASTKSASTKSASTKSASTKSRSTKTVPTKTVSAPRQKNTEMACRASLYEDYRSKCNNDVASCPLYTECGKYGVGTEVWPVTSYMPTNLRNRRDADETVRSGMDCSTHVMWNDPGYGPQLLKCGGVPPAASGLRSQRSSRIQ